MPTGASVQPAWLDFAWAELGQREISGPASNARIVDYIRRAGHPEAANDATPWCAAFVGACLERAGIEGTRSLLARSYLDWGEAAVADQLGAIAVLSRGRDPTFGHVGFLVGTTPEAVFLLGGNQSDAVNVARFNRSRLLGLRRPVRPPAIRPAVSNGSPGFAWSLARILKFEGGWTDDPFDPGGPTNKGITLSVYARARNEQVNADTAPRLKSELRHIPDNLVARIYLERYWRPASCPDLPPALAHFHFDSAVNQGVGTATRILQEALGVGIDGEIGPVTLSAARTNPLALTLDRYAAIRRRRYRSLGHFWRFGRGWLARVDAALAQANGLASLGAPLPLDEPSEPRPPPETTTTGNQPMPETIEPIPNPPANGKWWGESLTIWGVMITVATTVAPTILAALGLDVPPDVIERLGREALVVFQALGGLVGTVLSIAGRARAAGPLVRRAIAVRF